MIFVDVSHMLENVDYVSIVEWPPSVLMSNKCIKEVATK